MLATRAAMLIFQKSFACGEAARSGMGLEALLK